MYIPSDNQANGIIVAVSSIPTFTAAVLSNMPTVLATIELSTSEIALIGIGMQLVLFCLGKVYDFLVRIYFPSKRDKDEE